MTRHKPSYQGWVRLAGRRKRFPKAGERVRDTPLPLLGVTQNHQANNHNVFTEDLAQTHACLVITASVLTLYLQGLIFEKSEFH